MPLAMPRQTFRFDLETKEHSARTRGLMCDGQSGCKHLHIVEVPSFVMFLLLCANCVATVSAMTASDPLLGSAVKSVRLDSSAISENAPRLKRSKDVNETKALFVEEEKAVEDSKTVEMYPPVLQRGHRRSRLHPFNLTSDIHSRKKADALQHLELLRSKKGRKTFATTASGSFSDSDKLISELSNGIVLHDDLPGRKESGAASEAVLVCVLPFGTQLANGLRHMATCYVLAKASGRAFMLDPNESMSSTFFSTFFRGFCQHVACEQWEQEMGCKLISEDDAFVYRLRQHPYTNWSPGVEGVCDLAKLAAEPRVALKSIYAVKPRGMSDGEYFCEKLAFYRRVRWPANLAQLAREWGRASSASGEHKLVGVHVRYTDNFWDENKVKHGLNTPLKEFERAVRRVAGEGGCRVLLCSDSQQAVAKLGRSCASVTADGAFLRPPVVSRDRYLQALFEMLLLANCDLIIGSTSSTFSYEAAFLCGGTDIMVCDSGVWHTFHLRGLLDEAGDVHARP